MRKWKLSRAGRAATKAFLSRNRRSQNKIVKKKVEEDEVINNNNNKNTE